MSTIPLCQFDLLEQDLRSIADSIRNGAIFGTEAVQKLEHTLARWTAQSDCVTTGSYADAALLLFKAMDVREGDEVIVPAFASPVMTQAVIAADANPVFVDCHPRTLNIDLEMIEAAVTPRTRAVVGTAVFGNPAGMPQLAALCGLMEIPLIEDVAGGIGGTVDQRPLGAFGRAAVIDLGHRTAAGCGSGGAICSADRHIIERLRTLAAGRDATSIRGDDPGPLGHATRLTSLQAAVVLPQLDRLEQITEARASVAASYTRRLAGVNDIIVPTMDPGTTRAWPEFVVRLDESYGGDDRDEIIHGLERHDIGAGRPWPPPPLGPEVAARVPLRGTGWPVAEFVAQRTIALPMFGGLTDRDAGLVTQTLELMMQRTTFRRG